MLSSNVHILLYIHIFIHRRTSVNIQHPYMDWNPKNLKVSLDLLRESLNRNPFSFMLISFFHFSFNHASMDCENNFYQLSVIDYKVRHYFDHPGDKLSTRKYNSCNSSDLFYVRVFDLISVTTKDQSILKKKKKHSRLDQFFKISLDSQHRNGNSTKSVKRG